MCAASTSFSFNGGIIKQDIPAIYPSYLLVDIFNLFTYEIVFVSNQPDFVLRVHRLQIWKRSKPQWILIRISFEGTGMVHTRLAVFYFVL